jgi:hypothetical protein
MEISTTYHNHTMIIQKKLVYYGNAMDKDLNPKVEVGLKSLFLQLMIPRSLNLC